MHLANKEGIYTKEEEIDVAKVGHSITLGLQTGEELERASMAMELPRVPPDCCKINFFKLFSESKEAGSAAFVCEFFHANYLPTLAKECKEEMCAVKEDKEEEMYINKEEEGLRQ